MALHLAFTRPCFPLCHAFIFLIAISSIAHEPGPTADQLVTRSYKIDLSKLPSRATNSPSHTILSLITNAGVTFPSERPIASMTPSTKTLHFNDDTGELLIRETRRDIPKIEKVIEPLWKSTIATPIELDMVIVDLPESATHPISGNQLHKADRSYRETKQGLVEIPFRS
jgi:hypothetical protein